MRSLVFFFILFVAIYGQYDDASNSADSAVSLENASSSSEEEVIGEVIVDEGSGSGEVPEISVGHIEIFGILPGPGDIRKKRSIMEVLSRK